MSETIDLIALRKPFPPELVGKLPRVTCGICSDRNKQCGEHIKKKCNVCQAWVSEKHIHIDYVGHADVTSRLLEVDPAWNWEPKAEDDHGMPVFDLDKQGQPVGMWIKLTVGGVTRLGYGSCPSGQSDAVKVLIGDALRNAAMRFGVALDLWAKGDRADPTAENATASAGQASRQRQSAADAFETGIASRPRPGGKVTRAAQPKPPEDDTAPAEVDIDAQAYADEAHDALTLHDIEDIQRRAREDSKLQGLVRNPSSNGSGKPGKLALYLDWKRKQIKEIDDAMAELTAVATETGFPVAEIETHVKSVTGTDLETANAAQIRHATQTLRTMQGAAA